MGRYDEFLIDKPPTLSEATSSDTEQQNPTDSSSAATDLEASEEATPAPSADVATGNADDADGDSAADHDPLSAALPDAIAGRDQSTVIKPRYKGHAAFNNMVRRDWIKAIESDYSAFQALLYLPDMNDVGEVDDETGFEKASFTELNNNQRTLSYQDVDPVVVTVLDCPDERESFQVLDADGEQDGFTDDVLILRIAAEGVPVGSILEWNEEMASGALARRWWYVHRIYGFGTQNVGSLYYCIPARNFDTTSNGRIE
ncbi:phage tail protein [Enterobacter sp. BRE11]|nr:phage tail protein [Enterobacter sp. BRE11]